jgi:acyl-CoA thioesterase FadM
MIILFRVLWTVGKALFRSKMEPLDESVLSLRVWPNDMDINFHLNNGRYLTLMDLGRFDLTVRMGLLKPLIKFHWRPLVASAHIRFFKALGPLQKFQLKTRILYMDEKWVYIEQRFVADSATVAVGRIKALFRGPRGNISTRDLIQASGRELDLQALDRPNFLENWEMLDQP